MNRLRLRRWGDSFNYSFQISTFQNFCKLSNVLFQIIHPKQKKNPQAEDLAVAREDVAEARAALKNAQKSEETQKKNMQVAKHHLDKRQRDLDHVLCIVNDDFLPLVRGDTGAPKHVKSFMELITKIAKSDDVSFFSDFWALSEFFVVCVLDAHTPTHTIHLKNKHEKTKKQHRPSPASSRWRWRRNPTNAATLTPSP